MPLSGEGERLCFDLNKDAPDHTDRTIKIGRLCRFEIGEEPPDPRRQMPVEEVLLPLHRYCELARDQTRHDFAEDRCVVLGLALAVDPLDSQFCQVSA